MNCLFPYRIRAGRKFLFLEQRMVVQVGSDRIIKGPCMEQELEALQFVAKYTTIPVPKVHRTYRRNEGLFIEMDFVKGVNLETVWETVELSNTQKSNIFKSIEDYVSQLRSFTSPDGVAVGSVTGGPVKDGRITHLAISPFTNITDFHRHLRRDIPLERCTEAYCNDVLICHQRNYQTVFAHADLCPRNIILDPEGVPVIIDWECAGWWPEYWEYTKCYFAIFKDTPGWLNLVDEYLKPYPEELKAERALWQPPKDVG